MSTLSSGSSWRIGERKTQESPRSSQTQSNPCSTLSLSSELEIISRPELPKNRSYDELCNFGNNNNNNNNNDNNYDNNNNNSHNDNNSNASNGNHNNNGISKKVGVNGDGWTHTTTSSAAPSASTSLFLRRESSREIITPPSLKREPTPETLNGKTNSNNNNPNTNGNNSNTNPNNTNGKSNGINSNNNHNSLNTNNNNGGNGLSSSSKRETASLLTTKSPGLTARERHPTAPIPSSSSSLSSSSPTTTMPLTVTIPTSPTTPILLTPTSPPTQPIPKPISTTTPSALSSTPPFPFSGVSPTEGGGTLRGKKEDVEGLMTRVWDKFYKQGELYIQIVDTNTTPPKLLADTDIYLIVESKTFAQRYGQDFLIEVEDRSFKEIVIEVCTLGPLNTRKKIGACRIPVQGILEDGKPHEAWHNLAKRSRKGEIKSKGHLKVRICYTSALIRNNDFCMAKQKHTEIMKILLDKDTLIVCTLCSLYKEEDLSKALIRLYNSQKKASFLLTNLLTREIYSQDDTATLFRRDSMGTKTARNFFSLVAKSYLKKLILPFVAFVSYSIKKGNCYEVDPKKLKSTEEIPKNATQLLAAAKKFLSSVLDSCDELPISVRLFFCNLNTVVRNRIKSTSPIGALFFLRFVCPAVLFPSQYGLMEKPLDENIFRALVLVTKILQNLVNGCLFKEEYMTIFNSFIFDNISPIHGFFEQLCTEPHTNVKQDDVLPPYTDEEIIQLLSIVVRKLHIYMDKIQAELEQDPLYTSSPDVDHQKYLFAKLKTMFLERILTSSQDEKDIEKLL